MKTKTVNEVGFDEIFHYAAKDPWNVGWNDANDLFFNSPLDYGSTNDIYLEDMVNDNNYVDKNNLDKEDDQYLAYEIMIAFMKENNITKMTVNSK